MNNYKRKLEEITETAKTWREIKTELSKFNIHDLSSGLKDTRAGKIFEVFTKHYFKTSPSEKDNYKNVWLFEEVPTKIRSKLNIGNIDYGVDLVLEDTEGLFYAVQCKFKNDENSILYWTADKIANLFAFCPNADGYIVFSNATDLDPVSKTRHDKFTFYSITNLLEIDSDVIEAIYQSLANNKEIERKLFNPKLHQEKAISDCVEFFEIENRGQLILPCGAGKTLTALWIKEKLDCRNTLVLVPSLALLRQIKNEWAKQRRTNYKYICVCSEADIDKDTIDTLVTHTYEIDIHVTTNPEQISSFLKKDYQEKVIFSTYHSLESVADAILGSGFEFDFIFCDEAHKTAGIGQNRFSLVHDNDRIPSKRRLYATATPRIVKESLKKKLGDDLKFAYDMNDPEIFGYEFHRMTFKEAIEAKPDPILVDYQIIAIGVNSEELREYIENRNYVDSHVTIDEIANNYALEHVMEKYNANHAITFHSRVKLAEEFVYRHSKLFNSVNTYSVNGDQTTSYRNIVLDDFKHSTKAVISNARCLTEGVDVPTIDLVYFSDPKNSKVDIVQAVGRALRKKDGKEKGFIVVPIYHTRHENVESSISESSFKNLLQVIRSLCEQDERLQDEINSLAFGKGKRKSNRIDFTNTIFSEEQDIILLEGFEEKLRNSLFDQIIEKTSNNWDIWFLQFKEWLENINIYPTVETNKELYQWVSQQRNRKKNGNLKNEEKRKLNSINFIWDFQEWKWYSMYYQLVDYSKENKFEPNKEDDEELAQWFITQKWQVKRGKLSEERQKLLEKISFTGLYKDRKWYDNFEMYKRYASENEFEPDEDIYPDIAKWIISQKNQIRIDKLDDEKVRLFNSIVLKSAVEKKWLESYNKLVAFRHDFSNKWPQYDSENPNSDENQLNIFCQIMRKRFREDSLSNYWFDKMAKLGFNFEGKLDNWTKYYEEVKGIITDRDSISISDIGENAYSWITRHKKLNEKGELTKYQSEKLSELDLSRFFETWDETFAKVEKWVHEKNKIPTKASNKDLYSWLYSQRSRYKNGTLLNEQIANLITIGFDLEGKGKEINEQKWLAQFTEYKQFVEFNGKEPSVVTENKLYIWVQSQRAHYAGNLRNRNTMPQNRLDLLNSIGFNWVGEGQGGDESWENNFMIFSQNIDSIGNINLPTHIDGVINSLYTWWVNQKKAFENGKMPEIRISRFKDIGIDFNKSKNISGRDGFTRWAKKLIEIADFIKVNGHYPVARKDKLEYNLYQSLARTKRSYKDGELSEKQLELLKELKIEIE
jgi:superfamily II DNA or RNA helicase